MNRINVGRSIAENRFVAWGKEISKNTGALVFAAVLIVCSVTVGCSSDKPKPVSSNNQIPVTPMPSTLLPVDSMLAQSKPAPAPKKVVHKKPATVNYNDKNTGVTFEYPRRYAIETGPAATELLASNPIAMNFVQPGGVALAAVELPETSFANTDLSSAFFNVSVHKGLTADQCNEFAVPAPKAPAVIVAAEAKTGAVAAPATTEVPRVARDDNKVIGDATVATAPGTQVTTAATPETVTAAPTQVEPQGSKLLIGDMELRATEAVSGEGTRQSDTKYFHVYQNGACYEFGLNVTTVASEEGVTKHVDRDKVFGRLETILSTVKINTVAAPEVAIEAPIAPVAETPAQ
jgi:hypothetical protein